MNETNYNFAMFGKEYLDKAIEGIQIMAPKAFWYLQWKCWIDVIGYLLLLIIGTIYILKFKMVWQILAKKVEEGSYDDEGWVILQLFSVIVLTIIIITMICIIKPLVVSLTPICPIDKAIEIGKSLLP